MVSYYYLKQNLVFNNHLIIKYNSKDLTQKWQPKFTLTLEYTLPNKIDYNVLVQL